MKRAFVETGGFYALLSENDINHERALDVFRKANVERWMLVTTNVVVFETYALLLNRTGEGRSKALQFVRPAQRDAVDSQSAACRRLRKIAWRTRGLNVPR